MSTNREDDREGDKRPAGSANLARDQTADIAELFGAVVRLFLLIVLTLLRVAQRGLGTVLDSNGRNFPDLVPHLLGSSLDPGSAPSPMVAAPTPISVPAFTPMGRVKAEDGSPVSTSCAAPSAAGPSLSQRRNRWYVITAGLRTGVFTDWLEAGRYVSGVTGAIFRGYDSEEEAVDAYNEAVRAGHVRVVPDINNVLNRTKFGRENRRMGKQGAYK
ncbi:hypothetical protein DFH11DRAFT_1727965 [Phellopilus nigrolimitatus]|nr:hypothetical protein DFH11DRAFT_1727965 [Phellopilus nigrolimitatus]